MLIRPPFTFTTPFLPNQIRGTTATLELAHKGNINDREIEKFIIRQPPIGDKDDYDSKNSWISDGLPSSSRRRRRGGGRWEVGENDKTIPERDRAFRSCRF